MQASSSMSLLLGLVFSGLAGCGQLTRSEPVSFRRGTYTAKYINTEERARMIREAVGTLPAVRVGIDVGHGCDREGCEWGSLNAVADVSEYWENYAQAFVTAEILAAAGAEVTVFHWRADSAAEGLPEPSRYFFKRMNGVEGKGDVASRSCGASHDKVCTIFVSIHKNSLTECAGTQGSEVFFPGEKPQTPKYPLSKELANRVQRKLVTYLWGGDTSRDRLNEVGNYGIYTNLAPGVEAAILTESYYLCSVNSRTAIRQMSENAAVGLAEAIADFIAAHH